MSLLTVEKTLFGDIHSLNRQLNIDDFDITEVDNYSKEIKMVNVGISIKLKESVVNEIFETLNIFQNQAGKILSQHPFSSFFKRGDKSSPESFVLISKTKVTYNGIRDESKKEEKVKNLIKATRIKWEKNSSSIISEFMDTKNAELNRSMRSINEDSYNFIRKVVRNPKDNVNPKFFMDEDGPLSDGKRYELKKEESEIEKIKSQISELEKNLKTLKESTRKIYSDSLSSYLLASSGPMASKIIKETLEEKENTNQNSGVFFQ